MTDRLRLTAVAILPGGMDNKSIPSYLEQIVAGEDPAVVRTIYRTTEVAENGQRFYAKVSKLIESNEISEGWHLKVTERFRNTGCDDVAWRITKIAPEDTDAENTTESFPIDLFQSNGETYAEETILPEVLEAPFGSDAFWQWFVKDTE